MSNSYSLEEGTSLSLDFSKRGGLVPVVVQEAATGTVLMVAYANQEAWEKTRLTRKATFFSTSRKELWTKGDTSGDALEVLEVLTDCDQDALIYKVKLLGQGVCHTWAAPGTHRHSCFYRRVNLEKNTLEKQ